MHIITEGNEEVFSKIHIIGVNVAQALAIPGNLKGDLE